MATTAKRWNPHKSLREPLGWRKPRRAEVVGELFDEGVPLEFIDQAFCVMGIAKQHTFLVTTQHAERMACYMNTQQRIEDWYNHWYSFSDQSMAFQDYPLPNVWLGVHVTRQQDADERIPHLLRTPAAVRFVRATLRGPVDLREWLFCDRCRGPHECGPGAYPTPLDNAAGGCWFRECRCSQIRWVIVSGDKDPVHPAWVRSLRDQCAAAGVPFCFEGWGEWLPQCNDPFQPKEYAFIHQDGRIHKNPEGITSCFGWTGVGRVGKKNSGRLLDWREWNEMPEGGR